MKKLLHGFAMCQSMFCALPCPWHGWDEDARGIMLRMLPALGLEMGLLWWAVGALGRFLGLNSSLLGLVLCACPFLLSGKIHLDGFLDVTDAIGSWRPLEKRRQILKDSHVGAMAVMGCGLVLLAQFACCTSLEGADLRCLIFIPAVSRSCSLMAVSCLPKMETSQYSHQRGSRADMAVGIAMLLACGAFALWLDAKYVLVALGGCLGYGLSLRHAYGLLEGMNGDMSGYSLTLSELSALAVLALLSGGMV